MKAIMMSIKPEWIAKILNGIKTLEIRKRFPADYVGWVYIYCTKDKPYLAHATELFTGKYGCVSNDEISYEEHNINGKVVARFWCDKVEEIDHWYSIMPSFKQTCLSPLEFADYIGSGIAYAIHITKLEIFDKPKVISEFKRYINDSDCKKCAYGSRCPLYPCDKIPLTRAPESWCYIEI